MFQREPQPRPPRSSTQATYTGRENKIEEASSNANDKSNSSIGFNQAIWHKELEQLSRKSYHTSLHFKRHLVQSDTTAMRDEQHNNPRIFRPWQELAWNTWTAMSFHLRPSAAIKVERVIYFASIGTTWKSAICGEDIGR